MSVRTASRFGLALLGLAVAWPALPQAATETRPIHPWYSSARFQIGSERAIPITFAPLPRGRVRPPGPAVTVQQGTTPATTATTLPSGRPIQLARSRMTAPGDRVVVPFYLVNPEIFQINTSVAVYWPFYWGATLQAGGRTGPPTVSFCAFDVVTTNYNPACTGPGQYLINGRMRYTKTANQFGGPAPGRLEGKVDLGVRGAGTPPCNFATGPCRVIWASADPPWIQATGNYFGFYASTPGRTIRPGIFDAVVQTFGTIVYMTPTGLEPGLGNGKTSFGGPWTTGRITISVTAATPPETFTLSGSDTRVAGEGVISLVSGALSNRALSGPHANRGWVSLYVPEPGATLGAVGALLMLLSCHGLSRRRSR